MTELLILLPDNLSAGNQLVIDKYFRNINTLIQVSEVYRIDCIAIK